MNRREMLGAIGNAAGLGVVAAASASARALAPQDGPVVTFSSAALSMAPEELARAIRDAMLAAGAGPLSPILYVPEWADEDAIRHALDALTRYAATPGTALVLPDGWRLDWAYCGSPCVAYTQRSETTP